MPEPNTIGPYRLIEPIGRGGMGVVYHARHVNSDLAVALKTVEAPASKWIDSIRREIQALTRIRHPGIVRIIDQGVHQGRPWYAMDLVEGESLRTFCHRLWSPYRRLAIAMPSTEQLTVTEDVCVESPGYSAEAAAARQSTLGPGVGKPPAAAGKLTTALKMMRRICSSLAFLHGEGFVNCDLKPDNVLLVHQHPVIIDFGLSTHHPGGSGREALDVQHGLSGTLPYMSPEQIRREFLDARSDLYAIGCMLYELVTGTPPFTGSPRQVIRQHLSATPVPPSQIVTGVSPELERLMLRLLEKSLTDRYGYADEVAAELADLSGDVSRLTEYPPSRSYLYRPRFVGRATILEGLVKMRERAATGRGCFVMIGGESGVGKTRLAMELTRVEPSNRIRVVTSEASALVADSAAAVAPAPLHALKTFLQAIADRCQEGGPAVTDQLLGERRGVLALYEPLLAHVPAGEPLPSVLPLGAEASRQRLFAYLSETLAAFVHERPLLWVLDDLGWADELSLAFLQSLSAEYLESHALLIVGAYRTEEPPAALRSIAEQPHVLSLELPRLAPDAVELMIRDMLALREPLPGFNQFVSAQAEGNPFFVAEYLRNAVAERLLHRNRRLNWQLKEAQANRTYESLGLPNSLRDLIENRLRKLSPGATSVSMAAAVLGRETDPEMLRAVADLSEESTTSSLDELLRHQIFEQPAPQSIRFAHDKLREVTYAQAPPDRLRELHFRAATALERRARTDPSAHRHWATLGHHFAAAHQPDRAAEFIRLAADHAKETHANAEAIRLYREAINQVRQIESNLPAAPSAQKTTLGGLHEALADVLALVGQRQEARASFQCALRDSAEADPMTKARLFRKIGKTWETQHRHAEALASYNRAKDSLKLDPWSAPAAWRDEWLQIRVDQLWVYYWLGQVCEMQDIGRELRPLIEAHGTQAQKVRFFETQMMLNMRRDRYLVTEETLTFARAALEACCGHEELQELPVAQFGYGFALLHHRSLPAAVHELTVALTLARRAGDAAQQARSMAYLVLANRTLCDLDTTERVNAQLVELAESAGTKDYMGVARANQSWLRLRRGDPETSIYLAQSAIEIWNGITNYAFPFRWIAYLPLMESLVSLERVEEAIACISPLMEPSQQCLPGKATDILNRAEADWAAGTTSGSAGLLSDALESLRLGGYV